jgi:hypothetical protein
MNRFVALTVVAALAACADDVEPVAGAAPEGGSDPVGAGPVGGSGIGGASDGGNGGIPGNGGASVGGSGGAPAMFDCATAPTAPLSEAVLPGLRGYHGLAVSGDGLLYGLDTGWTLGRGSHDGDWQPLVANVFANQMDFGPDGDLFLAGDNGLIGISTDAQPYTINTDVGGLYGIRVGPDNQIYAADPNGIRRVEPVTGVAESVVTLPSYSGHSFDFSPGYDRLYVGTIGQGILSVALDQDLVAQGALAPFAPLGPFSWVDGVATDACGTVYAVDYDTKQLLRITEAGEVGVFVQWSDEDYGHGLIFGNGVGGFRDDALYLPVPYSGNAVLEVVVGVPSRAAGLALDGP